jgi:hypothetical protein
MSIAPARQTMVPTIFAMLLELLKSTFSNLQMRGISQNISSHSTSETVSSERRSFEGCGSDRGSLSPTVNWA